MRQMGIKVRRVKMTMTEAAAEQLWPPSSAASKKAVIKASQQ